jgi:hypothetical protein
MIPQSAKRLIRSLQEPGTFEQGVSDVQTLQTHMSWVLLAGPHAYKIKKPVDFGFADFSTLSRRRHFCDEELRVNRRLAPELYLGVVPICGTPEAPGLGGPGDPIEYAVKMKRFPQEALLHRVLQREELTGEHVDELVRQAADFHGRVEVDVNGRGFGTPQAVWKPMESNFQDLEEHADDRQVAAQLERLRRWSEQRFQAGREAFAARKREGFVRECHGDMHLGNMILWDDALVIFDAIEFNESLRWIDVLSELAFLVMDLEDRGRADFARRALNGYLEITGDYAGLAVVPYYLAYRPLVRAKVSGIRRRQKGVDDRQRRRLDNELRTYLRLAEGYTSTPPPKLIITHGVSASGKTTGAERLVESLGAIRIRSDVERKRLFGLDPLARTRSDLNEGLYSPESTRRCYERLAELAETVVRAGFTVIVDAAFLDRGRRRAMAESAAQLGVPFLILDFRADEETLRTRIDRRETAGGDASEAGLAVLKEQRRAEEPLSNGEKQSSIGVNTAGTHWLDTLAAAVQEWCGGE